MSGFFESCSGGKSIGSLAYIIACGIHHSDRFGGFPAWELPNWTLRLVVVLLLMGFPIALILAWALRRYASGNSRHPGITPARN